MLRVGSADDLRGAEMKLKAALFLSACVLSHPALAQDAAPPAAAAEETEHGENILVTGSRIRRDGFEAPTPLTVLSREDIDNSSPTNNIADFVNQLPQLAGSTRPANSRLNL